MFSRFELDKFNYRKDFVKVETDAFIVAAAMRHFNMDTIGSSDTRVHSKCIKHEGCAYMNRNFRDLCHEETNGRMQIDGTNSS